MDGRRGRSETDTRARSATGLEMIPAAEGFPFRSRHRAPPRVTGAAAQRTFPKPSRTIYHDCGRVINRRDREPSRDETRPARR